MNHFARALVRRDGNDAHDLCKRFYQGVLVGAFEHDEANRAVDGRDEQYRIRHRSMIGREQRSAARRHVFAAHHVQAIQRMRGDPKEKPQ